MGVVVPRASLVNIFYKSPLSKPVFLLLQAMASIGYIHEVFHGDKNFSTVVR